MAGNSHPLRRFKILQAGPLSSHLTLSLTAVSMRALTRALKLPLGVKLAVLAMLLLVGNIAVIFFSLYSAAMEHRLEFTGEQRALLIADPHRHFYSARLYERLSRGNVLHRLPRYHAIALISGYFVLFPDSYCQTVARHLPFRVTLTPLECDIGLDSAARKLFAVPVQEVSADQLKRLIAYSVCPSRHPLANSAIP